MNENAYPQITMTGEGGILMKKNDMSFPGGSRLRLQPQHHGVVSGFPKEKQGTIYQKQPEAMQAGRNPSYHQIRFIPIPHETPQINVKGEVTER